MKKRLLFIYVLLICGSIFAQPFPQNGLKAKDKVPFMPKAKTGVLKNGLTYYVLENKMPAGRAFINLAVNAGSVLEEENERGLAHFVEHMAFNGTARFPNRRLSIICVRSVCDSAPTSTPTRRLTKQYTR